MRWGVLCGSPARAAISCLVLFVTIAASSPAFAQTTQILSVPDTQIVDTMIRNGAYATINHNNAVLLTRWSAIPDWERRSIFSINTSSVPQGSQVTSAVLSLAVRSGLGGAGATTPVTVYRLASSFVESQATWVNRQTGVAWATPGGDLAEAYGTVNVHNVANARVDFDVTAIVQRAVNGTGGSRQALLALIDVTGGGDGKNSYREYHSSESSSTSLRPRVTVTFGPAASGTIDGLTHTLAVPSWRRSADGAQPGSTRCDAAPGSGSGLHRQFRSAREKRHGLHHAHHGRRFAASRGHAH